MALLRNLFYLLSLSSVSFAGEQDVLQPDIHPSEQGTLRSHGSLVLVTKTITYDEHVLPTLPPDAPTLNTPENPTLTCIPSTQDCCSASEHCFPGDYCYIHSGKIRCCPEGLECYQLSGDVCYTQNVVWYEGVHIVGEFDDQNGDLEREVITSWELQEAVQETKTRVTVSASYPAEGRASFAALSESLVHSAIATSLSLLLDVVPTRTVTGSRTPTATAESFLDELYLADEGQVVMYL
ncbi:uncharacterized protein BDV14DRAFT_204101 [Aspergillus stella-maris]|uniref:uncharacterized protein n=1 Tax=Aspergillus stella-maris TaxID=1810926 RepID=UPI003CCD933F